MRLTYGLDAAEAQIRNSKSETRNKVEYQNSNVPNSTRFRFGHLDFEFVRISIFDIRICLRNSRPRKGLLLDVGAWLGSTCGDLRRRLLDRGQIAATGVRFALGHDLQEYRLEACRGMAQKLQLASVPAQHLLQIATQRVARLHAVGSHLEPANIFQQSFDAVQLLQLTFVENRHAITDVLNVFQPVRAHQDGLALVAQLED